MTQQQQELRIRMSSDNGAWWVIAPNLDFQVVASRSDDQAGWFLHGFERFGDIMQMADLSLDEFAEKPWLAKGMVPVFAPTRQKSDAHLTEISNMPLTSFKKNRG